MFLFLGNDVPTCRYAYDLFVGVVCLLPLFYFSFYIYLCGAWVVDVVADIDSGGWDFGQKVGTGDYYMYMVLI